MAFPVAERRAAGQGGASRTLVSLSGSSTRGDPRTYKAHSPPAYPHTVLLVFFFFYFFFYFVFFCLFF